MDQLHRVVGLVSDVAGSAIIGAYLHGSAVLDGLKPASDIDVLVVTRRTLDGAERQALVDGLLRISGSGTGPDDRPVELTVAVRAEIHPWRFPPVCDFLFGAWERAAYEAGKVPQPAPMPDLALLAAVARAGNRPLLGPSATQALDRVPVADLVHASVEAVPGLLDEVYTDTRNVVLTLARIWMTVATGAVGSKQAAAQWALPRLAPAQRSVLAHAEYLYINDRYFDDRWSEELTAQIGPFVDEVVAEIRRIAEA